MAKPLYKKIDLCEQKILILDPGASPTSVSQGFLDKHKIYYKTVQAHDPPKKIRTAKGTIQGTHTARINFFYERELYSIDALVLATDKVTPILFGSNSLKKIKAKFDFQSGVMTINGNLTINWEFSKTSGLWFFNLLQPSTKDSHVMTSNVLIASNETKPDVSSS